MENIIPRVPNCSSVNVRMFDHNKKQQQRSRSFTYRESLRAKCAHIIKKNLAAIPGGCINNQLTYNRNYMEHFDDIVTNDEIINVTYDHAYDLDLSHTNNDSSEGGRDDDIELDSHEDIEPVKDFFIAESPSLENNIDSEDDDTSNKKYLQILEFIRDANLDKASTDRLMRLLNNVNEYAGLPRTGRELWHELGVEFNYRTFISCTKCNKDLLKFGDKCNCIETNHLMNTEFVLFSLADEIRRVVKNNIDLIEFFRIHKAEFPYDIVNGNLYVNRIKNNPITLILGSDGKPTFKSSKTSAWPVLCTIAEIPPPIRDYQQNVMLFGLYHSPVGPTAESLLGKIVKAIERLRRTGLTIDLGARDKIQTFDVHVQLIVGDFPARSKFNLLSGHAGYFACSRCLINGVRCKAHQHILYTWLEYRTKCPVERTDENMHISFDLIETSRKTIRPNGVIGKSPLCSILSIPKQSVFDYFHTCLKVHLPVLISKWVKLLSKVDLNKADIYLSGILYPHSFNRHPKKLSMFDQWKASQMRTFFLYVSLPLLIHLGKCLPSAVAAHFSLFYIYIRTLIFFYNRSDVLAMRPFIECYLEQFSLIYDECNELLSTHVHVHLWEQCLQHGALAFHSMFVIESSLNHLAKMAHGTVSLGEQISFWYSIDRYLQSKKKKRTSNIFLQNHLFDYEFFDQRLAQQYEKQFFDNFYQFFGHTNRSGIRFSSRFRCGLCVFHSLAYNLRKKSASFRVCVYNSVCSKLFCFGEVIFFFHYQNNEFFFFKQMLCSTSLYSKHLAIDDRIIPSWSDRIDQYFYTVDSSSISFLIYPCSSLLRKCIFIPFEGNEILCTNIDHELEHD
ncbi:unnamed protein product [Rotaria magnacalcarata]|uniref:Transposase domain-containing protein n=1 Tax=Rotaria magnacalcarata TaxID=392030 RepID=A0A816NYZ9_9BILA|nr:unnamed protein product [Rotaria magnacalcarata]